MQARFVVSIIALTAWVSGFMFGKFFIPALWNHNVNDIASIGVVILMAAIAWLGIICSKDE